MAEDPERPSPHGCRPGRRAAGRGGLSGHPAAQQGRCRSSSSSCWRSARCRYVLRPGLVAPARPRPPGRRLRRVRSANDVDDQALDDAIAIIRSRVDALGVAEPEIVRQGDAIVVNLPGVEDQQRALEVIGATAELRFRPVLQTGQYLTAEVLASASTSTTAPSETTDARRDDHDRAGETTTSTSEAALGEEAIELAALPAQDSSTTTTTAAPADTATTDADERHGHDRTRRRRHHDDGPERRVLPCSGGDHAPGGRHRRGHRRPAGQGATRRRRRRATRVLPARPGPRRSRPDGCSSAASSSDPEATIIQGQWQVTLSIKGEDLDLFNQTAAECFSPGPSCPTGRLAIVLDGVVQSAPTINEPAFDSSGLTISGSFTQGEAKDLALVLRFGALPIELVAQTVQQVSPTLGKDSLRAGLVAGFLGIALVAIYMLLYYRALGVVVLLGLTHLVGDPVLRRSSGSATRRGWRCPSPGSPASSCRSASPSTRTSCTSSASRTRSARARRSAPRSTRGSNGPSARSSPPTCRASSVPRCSTALTVGPVRGFAFFLGLSTDPRRLRRLVLHPPVRRHARPPGVLHPLADVRRRPRPPRRHAAPDLREATRSDGARASSCTTARRTSTSSAGRSSGSPSPPS